MPDISFKCQMGYSPSRLKGIFGKKTPKYIIIIRGISFCSTIMGGLSLWYHFLDYKLAIHILEAIGLPNLWIQQTMSQKYF
jgi:hypothetical protein